MKKKEAVTFLNRRELASRLLKMEKDKSVHYIKIITEPDRKTLDFVVSKIHKFCNEFPKEVTTEWLSELDILGY